MSWCPLEVASAPGSIEAEVATVTVLVEKVSVSGGEASLDESLVRKTRAKLGAGTVMEQVFVV